MRRKRHQVVGDLPLHGKSGRHDALVELGCNPLCFKIGGGQFGPRCRRKDKNVGIGVIGGQTGLEILKIDFFFFVRPSYARGQSHRLGDLEIGLAVDRKRCIVVIHFPVRQQKWQANIEKGRPVGGVVLGVIIDPANKIDSVVHKSVVVLDFLRELIVLAGVSNGIGTRKAGTIKKVDDELLLQ